MNIAAIAVQTLPTRVDCEADVWVRLIGAWMFAIAVEALETWLRVPVRPLLDGYLQAALSRASSLVAVLRNSSF